MNKSRNISLQKGMTLLELLVGITLGAMVIAAALGTLVMSKSITSTTDELATMEQDATFALNLMGRLISQAGSLEPNQKTSDFGIPMISFRERAMVVINGTNNTDSPDVLTVGTQSGSSVGVNVDCFGNSVEASEYTSTFDVGGNNELRCTPSTAGSTTTTSAQAIIPNVYDLQVHYRVAQQDAAGNVRLRLENNPPAASLNTMDPYVTAVHVCLEMRGSEIINNANAQYTNCRGGDSTVQQRMVKVFRHVFYVRVS
ncbi:prepilin-type N-terminal cleavage/methylation domain-containing protein [Lampropedia puyangensis]|uniref:Prepilin-type N-terminal cleavage/methylation domain-containing protein n=1 Tax=Lampropedia puyangensis TaxID=1330072 RepID=A0A4S8F2Q5_9BURK|nr:PilW family protein [Lampropedia puyangensis]THT99401.1 prepilin-type N-terminal cleavage/methylation domain-containing protein [Lampropedia puyangensis]